MPAYAIFIRERTRDQAALDVYSPLAGASLDGHPAKVLAAYGPQANLEGPDSEGTVIVEFPTLEAAKAWYESPAYRAAQEQLVLLCNYQAFFKERL